MLKINETDMSIMLTRGDSAEIELTVKDAQGNTYDYSNDTAKFGIKRSALDKNVLLEKTFDENGKIYFDPDDTKDMEFGDYLYSVELTNVDESGEEPVTTVNTVIVSTFTLGFNVL